MKSMMKKTSFAAILFAIAMMVAAPAAQATTITEVQAMITQLKGKVEVVTLNSRQADKDRAGLLGKLNSVALTLDQGKFCDAVKGKFVEASPKVAEKAAEEAPDPEPVKRSKK